MAYVGTVATMWLIWMLSSAPTGLPGVVGSGDGVTATLGLWPAWFMGFGFLDLARRARTIYVDRDQSLS